LKDGPFNNLETWRTRSVSRGQEKLYRGKEERSTKNKGKAVGGKGTWGGECKERHGKKKDGKGGVYPTRGKWMQKKAATICTLRACTTTATA